MRGGGILAKLLLKERLPPRGTDAALRRAGLQEVRDDLSVEWAASRYYGALGEALEQRGLPDAAMLHALLSLHPRLSARLRSLGEEHKIPISKSGAPLPGTSPFSLNQIITRDADLFGRDRERRDLMDAIHKGQSVEILGEQCTGKSSLLRWLERHIPRQEKQNVVRIDAQSLAGRSEGALVAEVARQLGHQRSQSLSANGAVERLLESLCPLVLLIDKAEELAVKGHGFTRDFFSFCRHLCTAQRSLVWVSVSGKAIGQLFSLRGLSSDFLNHSEKIYLGGLEREAVEELLAPLDESWAEWAWEQLGGWVWGLQWIGDRAWRQGKLNREDLADELALDAREHFKRWWVVRDEREQAILKEAISGICWSGLPPELRQNLRSRGLLQRDGEFGRLVGAAWTEFVRHAQ